MPIDVFYTASAIYLRPSQRKVVANIEQLLGKHPGVASPICLGLFLVLRAACPEVVPGM